MTRTSRIIVAALCTVFVAGGAWAFASGTFLGSSNGSSQTPQLVVERKVKKIKVKPKPKKVQASAAPASSGGSYYATASSPAPQVVAPQKQAGTVEPEDDSEEGYEDDGGEVEHEEGDDD